MTIRHLRVFIEVADTGKISTAAANLYLSQPTVSQIIRELEDHYEVLLFERIAQKLYITGPKGTHAKERIEDQGNQNRHTDEKKQTGDSSCEPGPEQPPQKQEGN